MLFTVLPDSMIKLKIVLITKEQLFKFVFAAIRRLETDILYDAFVVYYIPEGATEWAINEHAFIEILFVFDSYAYAIWNRVSSVFRIEGNLAIIIINVFSYHNLFNDYKWIFWL